MTSNATLTKLGFSVLGFEPIVLAVILLVGLCLLVNGFMVYLVVRSALEERRQRRRDEIAEQLLADFALADAWRGFDEARARYEIQQQKNLSGRRS